MNIRPLSLEAYQNLIQVSLREKPANIWFKDANFLNVYSGQIQKRNIVISGKRIAYVGEREPLVSGGTMVIELEKNQIIVPGYIEPHGHPFQICNPMSWSEFLLLGGTTTSINDNLFFFNDLGIKKSLEFIEEMNDKNDLLHFWWARFDNQIELATSDSTFDRKTFEKWLMHPSVIQGGEFTSWTRFLKGDQALSELMLMARHQYDKRIEGHLPGASIDTLNAMAAAGTSADHESINGEDVINRINLGMYAALRHSSIRADLPRILADLKAETNLNMSLLMLSSDGTHPFFFGETGTDKMIDIVLKSGFTDIEAYRMATLNPATYYRLDQEIGSVSPGRLANLNVLTNLTNPTPLHVMVEGKWLKTDGTLVNNRKSSSKWLRKYFTKSRKQLHLTASHIDKDEGSTGIKLINSVISLPYHYNSKNPLAKDELYLSLIDRHGKWLINTRLKGFPVKLKALVSSYTASRDYILIGNNREAMIRVLHEMIEKNGGVIAEFDDGERATIPLELAGGSGIQSLNEIIEQSGNFVRKINKIGYRYEDPLYSLFFLTSTHLPNVRLTSEGVYLIKEGEIVTPVLSLQ